MFAAARKLALVLAVLCTAVTGLIHARSSDAPPAPGILAPGNCRMPCWEGIQPGITTAAEAARILDAHPWVASFRHFANRGGDEASILWTWNDRTPPEIDRSQRGAVWFRQGLAERIDIVTTIPYGEMWLQRRPPTTLVVNTVTQPDARIHFSTYPDQGIQTRLFVLCPLEPAVFWNTPVVLLFAREPADDFLSATAITRSNPRVCAR